MARKNNPKQTKEKIISVAEKLFYEKGYDNTSMQDIVTQSGMSKGAIFHHFTSKEEILNIVIDKQSTIVQEILNQWLTEMEGLSAKEKLILLLERNLEAQEMHVLDDVISSQMKDPRFVVRTMQESVVKSAKIFAKVMQEGVKDGSLTTEDPVECSEVFFLLINVWCDPGIFEADKEKVKRRILYVQKVMRAMGADIISDQLVERTIHLIEKIYGGE